MAYENRHVSERTAAYYEGMHARRDGKALDENPYKGAIGMNPLRWAAGWSDENEFIGHKEALANKRLGDDPRDFMASTYKQSK